MPREGLHTDDIKGDIDQFFSWDNWFSYADAFDFISEKMRAISGMAPGEAREGLLAYLNEKIDRYF